MKPSNGKKSCTINVKSISDELITNEPNEPNELVPLKNHLNDQ